MGVLVLTIGMIYLLNLKFNILKYLIERKIHFIFYSLLAAFFISLFVQFYENIYRLDNYWINKNGYLSEIIEDKEIISKDEKAFQNTVDICKKVKFDIAYINKYSPRKGTVSAKLYKDEISQSEKKRRWNILNDLINKN